MESLDYDISLSSSIRLIVHPRNYIYPEGILDFSDLLKLEIFRSSGIIQFYHYRNINVFESTRFGGREKGIYLRRKIYNIVTGDTIT